MRLRTKTTLALLFFVIFVFFVLFFVFQNNVKNLLEEQIGKEISTTIQSRGHHIESLLLQYKDITGMLAITNQFQDAVNENIEYKKRIKNVNKRIEKIIKSTLDIEKVRVINKEGQVIASNHEDTGLDLSSDELFLRARNDIYVQDLHISRFTGHPVLSFSAPIILKGRFSGVLVFDVVSDEIIKIVQDRIGLGETGEIYLVNQNNLMITPSGFLPDALFKQRVDIQLEEKPQVYKSYRGKKVLGTYYFIKDMKWFLLGEIDINEAYSSIASFRKILFVSLSGLLIITVILSFVITGVAAKPIEKLEKGVRDVMMGKMDIKVGIRTKDEIGHLSRMFDEMVVVLKDSRKHLEDHSQNLKKQVQERTIELDKKIKESEEQRKATLNVARDLETLNIDLEMEVKTRRKTEKELKKHREHLEELVSKRTAELEEKTKGIEESQHALTFLMEDVNEAREKLEQMNIELAEANKELEAFSYSVSHDLRAPLRAIKGFSKKLIKNHTGRINKEGERLLNVVLSNSMKMEKLIEDLLQFSRVGRSSIRLSDINMNALVTEVSGELKILYTGRNIKLNNKKIPSAYGDRSMVKQVFYNILSNAYKFTAKKKTANIEVGCLDKEEGTVYYVKDNGIGFDMKYAVKLFNVFQRLHSEKDFPGTGVGLAIVQRIIQRHGGQVWAEAAVDKGAIFFFTLRKRGKEKL